ncbi:MAG TPA: 4Fe-4S double cluster binding domain-containing protein [Clostridia bacterium]|nr:4Fe-4S double cluster binding domain-containing protein [Clostridia bacterium]
MVSKNFKEELKSFIIDKGASDVGFAFINDKDFGECKYALSIVVKLSDAIIDEIENAPTHTYFNHYRSVNAFIDSLLLQTGLFLERRGYKYVTVAASQSINKDGWNYIGRFSHKKTACTAGLGGIGKNSLFLHNKYGARVRLGTVFTDCKLTNELFKPNDLCKDCNLCVKACPSGAITGKSWSAQSKREDMFLPEKCSEYMKKEFKHIGRGAVCGICIKVCPFNADKQKLPLNLT